MTERVQRVVVSAPGTDSDDAVELREGEQLLIGRKPDWALVADAPGGIKRSMVVASPSVSANHVLLRYRDNQVLATDLGSRNGTWVALAPHGEIATAGASEPW
jgi:pSer/pThr/pTyr-binding forkhead associated (FHA) protein